MHSVVPMRFDYIMMSEWSDDANAGLNNTKLIQECPTFFLYEDHKNLLMTDKCVKGTDS